MMGLISWLAGTRAGRITAVIWAVLTAIFFACLKAFSLGKQSEKAKQVEESNEALRDRIGIDDEVTKMGGNSARHELSRWVPDDEKRL